MSLFLLASNILQTIQASACVKKKEETEYGLDFIKPIVSSQFILVATKIYRLSI